MVQRLGQDCLSSGASCQELWHSTQLTGPTQEDIVGQESSLSQNAFWLPTKTYFPNEPKAVDRRALALMGKDCAVPYLQLAN